MQWNNGYRSDVDYPDYFFPEQGPARLIFTCILNGHEPIAPDRPFTYCELGCGRGFTVAMLAACNPQGSFHAVDFMPTHIASANELAESAQLSNLTFLENSFAELAAGKAALPQFDFITMHGVYSWVGPEVRRHIVDFIARYLKPGGIVYVSYNAMPGWSSALPLQRLLLEHARIGPGSADMQLASGADFVQTLDSVQAKYIADTPEVRRRRDDLRDHDTGYLAHEYLNSSWEALYHADVARDLAAAKLDFVGSTQVHDAYPELCLTPGQRELLATMPDPAVRETFKDYFANTSFRKDVFVRGARAMTSRSRMQWMERTGLALSLPRQELELRVGMPIGAVNLSEELYGPLLDALAARPHTLAELAALPALKTSPAEELWKAAAVLSTTGQAHVYFKNSNTPDAAHRMNRFIATRVFEGSGHDVLASPLLGSGVPATRAERMVYPFLSGRANEHDADVIALRILQAVQATGKTFRVEGKPCYSQEECLAALRPQVEAVLTVTLPRWRQLGIVDASSS